jgi:hypothetical protein
MSDELHPRPQLTRPGFRLLDGQCGFAFDPEDAGRAQRWHERPLPLSITLPFSPESPASGIGDGGFHRVVWYRLTVTADDIAAAGLGAQGDRLLLHFGAVDRLADVWVDGTFVGHHEGGQTAFSFDVTDALAAGEEHVIAVRAEDDPLDAVIPRGKQDWHEEPHSIWYHRTTGIWRSVWLEAVPALHIASIAWTPDLVRATVHAEIELSRRPDAAVAVTIEARHGADSLVRMSLDSASDRISIDVPIAALRNGQAMEELLWSPERPTLIDVTVSVGDDVVQSYIGLRSVGIAVGRGHARRGRAHQAARVQLDPHPPEGRGPALHLLVRRAGPHGLGGGRRGVRVLAARRRALLGGVGAHRAQPALASERHRVGALQRVVGHPARRA